MTVAQGCYVLSKEFPKEEMYGLTAQLKRAAISVPANIAEGYGRENTGSYIQFLRVAQGSLKELETLLLLAPRVHLCSEERVSQLLHECDGIGRILRSLVRTLESYRQ